MEGREEWKGKKEGRKKKKERREERQRRREGEKEKSERGKIGKIYHYSALSKRYINISEHHIHIIKISNKSYIL